MTEVIRKVRHNALVSTPSASERDELKFYQSAHRQTLEDFEILKSECKQKHNVTLTQADFEALINMFALHLFIQKCARRNRDAEAEEMRRDMDAAIRKVDPRLLIGKLTVLQTRLSAMERKFAALERKLT